MYQIRKCEKYTSHQSSGVANLDPEKFKNLSIPYDGNSEEEFLNYISDNLQDLETILDEVDEETKGELMILIDVSWEEYFNSSWKFGDMWFESGKVNQEIRKNGYFETNISTEN